MQKNPNTAADHWYLISKVTDRERNYKTHVTDYWTPDITFYYGRCLHKDSLFAWGPVWCVAVPAHQRCCFLRYQEQNHICKNKHCIAEKFSMKWNFLFFVCVCFLNEVIMLSYFLSDLTIFIYRKSQTIVLADFFTRALFFRHLWLLYKCTLDHKWYSVCAITLHSYDWLGTVFFNCAQKYTSRYFFWLNFQHVY